jgi:hypothetical protein
MSHSTITITVDEKAANSMALASPEIRRKVEAMLGLRIVELLGQEPRSLEEIMTQASDEARRKGLTPEILEELLRGD